MFCERSIGLLMVPSDMLGDAFIVQVDLYYPAVIEDLDIFSYMLVGDAVIAMILRQPHVIIALDSEDCYFFPAKGFG
jgi:hypothetical protein